MTCHRSTRFVCIVVATSVLLLAACGGGEPTDNLDPGLTDTTITVGSWAPLSGPAAPWGTIGRGMEAYFESINVQGGIHGREINFILKDDQFQPARTVAAVREMVERDEVFAFVGGTGTAPGMAVLDYIVNRQIPWVGIATGAHHFTVPARHNIFSGLPFYAEEADLLVDYAVDALGMTRVGVLYLNDDFGHSGLAGSSVSLEERGMEIVEALPVELMDTDLSSHILRLREADADIVLLYVTPRHAATLLSEAARIGYRPQWMAGSPLADQALMHSLTNGLWENVIYVTLLDLVDRENPSFLHMQSAHSQFAAGERPGYYFYGGMMLADLMAEGLRRAGRELSREAFIQAMTTMEGYRSIGTPITYSDNPRHGTRAVRLAICRGSDEIEHLTEWVTSDLDLAAAIDRMEAGS